jgi:hypothetical protein
LFALCVPLSLNKYAGVSTGRKHLPDTRVLVAHKKQTIKTQITGILKSLTDAP